MAIAFCATGMVSCSDDDDDAPATSEIVKGDYVGTNVLKVGGTDMPSDNNVAKIVPESGDMVTVVLPQAPAETKAGMAMPNIAIKNVKVVNVGQDAYTFSVDTIDVVTGEMHVVGTGMSGEVKGNKMTLKYNFKPGKMPMYIDGSFEGTKK